MWGGKARSSTRQALFRVNDLHVLTHTIIMEMEKAADAFFARPSGNTRFF